MTAIDPITVEVLSHRLSTILEEGAAALRNTSGSPAVAQAGDCNVALLTAQGECVFIGRTLPSHALSAINAVDYILKNYAANPGVNPDDMFISNDPYISTPHQNCVVLVAPIHSGTALVGWASAGIHVGDIGGPIPGQCSVGAQSMWEEPARFPPLKIVDGGVIRKDIEDTYLSFSRTRLQNAMDLRAKIAANNTIKRRFLDIVDRYGAEVTCAVMDEVILRAEMKLRSILRRIPNGQRRHGAYLDYQNRDELQVYTCQLATSKTDDGFVFDFTGSSRQAPAVINATRVGLTSYMLRVLLAIFGYAIPLCPAAVLRVIRVVTEPGAIVHCTPPAGVSKGTSSIVWTAANLAVQGVSELLSGCEELRHRAVASFKGHMPTADFSGLDQHGDVFGGVLPRITLALGTGARAGEDGVDTGGGMEAEVSIPNIETNENRFPVLYLYRRQERDTGGPGQFRGGAAPAVAFVPHDVDRIPNVIFHIHGALMPSAFGMFGGYPGSTNEAVILRDSSIRDVLSRGCLPSSLQQVSGTMELPPLFGRSHLEGNDVYWVTGCGGGGFGDPLDREPARVLSDVTSGLVSRSWAEQAYGVIVSEEGAVDEKATAEQRRRTRALRAASASGAPASSLSTVQEPGHETSRPVTHKLRVHSGSAGQEIVQCRCGHQVCGADEDFRAGLATRDRLCSDIGPHYMRYQSGNLFQLREYYCPGCWALIDVRVVAKEAAGQERIQFVPPARGAVDDRR